MIGFDFRDSAGLAFARHQRANSTPPPHQSRCQRDLGFPSFHWVNKESHLEHFHLDCFSSMFDRQRIRPEQNGHGKPKKIR
jgi:hypothetical protein